MSETCNDTFIDELSEQKCSKNMTNENVLFDYFYS